MTHGSTNEELRSANEQLEAANDELRETTEQLSAVNVYNKKIIHSMSQSLIVWNTDNIITTWNPAAENIHGLRQLLEEIIPRNTTIKDYEVEHEFPDIGLKKLLVNAARIYRQGIGTQMILLSIKDITEQEQTQKNMRRGKK